MKHPVKCILNNMFLLFICSFSFFAVYCSASNKNIDDAFNAMLAQKEHYQSQIPKVTAYGKEAVPYLLQKLKDTTVVYSIDHPARNDDLGMPKTGWTDYTRIQDIAKEALSEIYKKSSPTDSYARPASQAVETLLQQELSPLMKQNPKEFLTKDYLSTPLYIIKTMGEAHITDACKPLLKAFADFMAKDSDWKWIPGRNLIGETLSALVIIGDKEALAQVVNYTRYPGCDFLYIDFMKALSELGKRDVTIVIKGIDADIKSNKIDLGTEAMVESLGYTGAKEAIPFLLKIAQEKHDGHEEYYLSKAIQSLGLLNAEEATEFLGKVLLEDKERALKGYYAETALRNIYQDVPLQTIISMMINQEGNFKSVSFAFLVGERGQEKELAVLKKQLSNKNENYQYILKEAINKIEKRISRSK